MSYEIVWVKIFAKLGKAKLKTANIRGLKFVAAKQAIAVIM